MRAIAAGYPPGTTFSMRTGQAILPGGQHVSLNQSLQQSQLAPQMANVNGQNVATGYGQAAQGMSAGPGATNTLNSLMGGGQAGPVNSVGPASYNGSIVKMAGGNQQQGSGIAIGNPPSTPGKVPVGGLVDSPPSTAGGKIAVPPNGPLSVSDGGPGIGPGVGNPPPGTPGVPPRLVGSSLGTGPMFPPAVPLGTPGGQQGDVYTAYMNYLTGANHGNSLPLFHYQPGAATLPSFNASGVLQSQRVMNGINPQAAYVPYGGLPGSNTQLPRAGGSTLNSTLANSGLMPG